MTTIAFWPDQLDCGNPYLKLYYNALKEYGLNCTGKLTFNNQSLLSQDVIFDAIHIQWNVEDIWRLRGTSTLHQLRGIYGLRSFLRLLKKMNRKIIWTIHDLQPHENANWVDRIGYRLMAHEADLCICHSDAARIDLNKRYGGHLSKTVVMPHGNYDGAYPKPVKKQTTLQKYGLSDQCRTLVCCGLIRQYKRYDLAIEAVKKLGPDYQLVVAGQVRDQGLFDALVAGARNQSNIKLLPGELNDQEMADLVHAADVILLPYERITSSAALLLAFTFARGVVTSDLPLFREIIQQNPKAGTMFPSGDVDSFAQAIHEFFEKHFEDRGPAARELADRFAWRNVVRPVVEWLQKNVPAKSAMARDSVT